MIEAIKETFTSGPLAEQMRDQYGQPLVGEIVDGLKQAPLEHRVDVKAYEESPEWQYALHGEAYFQQLNTAPDEVHYLRDITYSRFGGDTEVKDRPVFYIPGFTENMVGKVATGLEFAKRGKNVILPNYDSSDVQVNPETGKKDATYTRALDLLAIIKEENLTHETVDAATHSYGLLVLEAMQKIAKQRGWTCFEDSEVAAISPAAIKKEITNPFAYAARFARSQLGEKRKRYHKDFPDTEKIMEKASITSMMANKRRTAREVWELATRKVDLATMAKSGIRHLTIFGSAEDRLFSEKTYKSDIQAAIDAGVELSYATPVSFEKRRAEVLGITGATHNDDSFNPKRVVGAVLNEWQSRQQSPEELQESLTHYLPKNLHYLVTLGGLVSKANNLVVLEPNQAGEEAFAQAA